MYAQLALNGLSITWTDALAVVSIPSFDEQTSDEPVVTEKPRITARVRRSLRIPRAHRMKSFLCSHSVLTHVSKPPFVELLG
jgi:hypothetical protein